MMEKQKNEVISAIRACLISTKGMVELGKLNGDYKTLLGEKIPYAKLGFKKLEDFILSEPSLVTTRSNGEIYVDAKIDIKSAHISELVCKQKSEKKKVLRRAPRFYRSSPSVTTNNWRPRYIPQNDHKYHRSPRPAAVSHNQFVNRPSYNKPSVASKVMIPESSALYSKQISQTQPKKSDISSRLNTNGIGANNKYLNDKQLKPNGKALNKQHLGQGTSTTKDEDVYSAPCSSLSSARKRITQKMSQISLERDSGNSSPTNEMAVNNVIENNHIIKPIKILEFVPTGDAIKDLKSFVDYHKLGEINVSFKSLKTKPNRLITCLLKIGNNFKYNSYPEEFNTNLAAEKYCAEQALKELTAKYGKKNLLLLANYKDILERIPPMLEKHHHGIWVWQLQLDYADKYNEELPTDWLKIIDSSPCIQLEKCLDNYVLRHCKQGDVLQKGEKWNTFMTLTDVSVPSNTIQFGEDGKLNAEITCVMSANEVWCRQYNTEESVVYSEMSARMEIFYNQHENRLKKESITIGGYYVTKYDNMWCRIKAIREEGSEVLCFFIDFGDELTVSRDNIYELKREFALCQAQAFVCRLVGLEELYETSLNSDIVQSILYRQVILEIANEAVVAEDDLTLPVYVYDNENGNSINKELIPLLTIESASPAFHKERITEVYVSNIESNGDVYVVQHTHGYESLQNLLQTLEEQILQAPPTDIISPITEINSKNRVYFAKHKINDHWYRVQIIDWSPDKSLAQIYFVDYGNADVIKIRDEILYPLDRLSDVLNQYPFQAVKVKMTIDKTPEDFVALAQKAMPADHPVLLKIIDYDSEGVPLVEFFKRNHDGGLFCINKSITMETELKKGGDGNNNSKSSKRNRVHFEGNFGKNVPSGGRLQRPDLPNTGEYFELHVPFAVNPYNFFVQPLESHPKLHKMMEQLQERYKDVQYSPLVVDKIVPGNIYVSKHDDGNWYRTSVIKVIHSGSISVFYCDFGYYANLTVQQLIPLDPEFMELPYQALKAKIANIRPKQSKWTMDDCDDFKEMVEKKHFYSILVDIEKDELYESDLVLSLILIDTTSEEDIYIGRELITKGVAVEA